MKHAKRITSLLLALVMVLALGVTAFAAQQGTIEGGSITINDAVSGQTYNAYQILYIESYDSTTGAYSYKANSDWDTWLKSQTTYVSVDTQGYVTWVANTDDATVQAFAKAAQQQVSGKTPDATANASSTTVSFTGLKLGYYLVDTTLGTLCSLDTTNPNVTMNEKNSKPTVDKKVEEDSKTGSDAWGKTNDAEIGQTVNFETTITVGKGAVNYTLHDTMSSGLTLDTNSIKVKVNNTEIPTSSYTTKTSDCSDKCTFEIEFKNDYIATLAENTKIVVTYNATVNNGAVIGASGNPNATKVSYSEKSNVETETSTTTTYVWNVNIFKYTKKNDQNVALSGAKFVILNSDKTKVAVISNGKVQSWVDSGVTTSETRVTYPTSWTTGTEITSDVNGKIRVDGLDADTYYLYETAAPTGYNKLADAKAFTVKAGAADGAGSVTYVLEDGDNTVATNKVEVENKTGTELPSTGGVGTTIFYVLGSVLVIGAAVLLITKKRMNAEA